MTKTTSRSNCQPQNQESVLVAGANKNVKQKNIFLRVNLMCYVPYIMQLAQVKLLKLPQSCIAPMEYKVKECGF